MTLRYVQEKESAYAQHNLRLMNGNVGAGFRYAKRIIQDAPTGHPTDDDFLAVVRQPRDKTT